ncbi:hypothetical protein ACLOJK_029450 [Asimina triloba]
MPCSLVVVAEKLGGRDGWSNGCRVPACIYQSCCLGCGPPILAVMERYGAWDRGRCGMIGGRSCPVLIGVARFAICCPLICRSPSICHGDDNGLLCLPSGSAIEWVLHELLDGMGGRTPALGRTLAAVVFGWLDLGGTPDGAGDGDVSKLLALGWVFCSTSPVRDVVPSTAVIKIECGHLVVDWNLWCGRWLGLMERGRI